MTGTERTLPERKRPKEVPCGWTRGEELVYHLADNGNHCLQPAPSLSPRATYSVKDIGLIWFTNEPDCLEWMEWWYGEAIDQLKRFYGVTTLVDLVMIQARHVERLQEKLPPTPDLHPRKVREG